MYKISLPIPIANPRFESYYNDFIAMSKQAGVGRIFLVAASWNEPECEKQRIITLLDAEGKPHYLYNVQKMGLNGSIIDNNCMFTPVNLETGEMMYPAHSGDTVKGIIYHEHPNSHIPLVGYKIPFAKEAVEMCLKAATIVPQIRYIGWDVAITPNGPAIIEGNTYNAHDFWQLPPHTLDKIGMLPKICEIAPEFKY